MSLNKQYSIFIQGQAKRTKLTESIYKQTIYE